MILDVARSFDTSIALLDDDWLRHENALTDCSFIVESWIALFIWSTRMDSIWRMLRLTMEMRVILREYRARSSLSITSLLDAYPHLHYPIKLTKGVQSESVMLVPSYHIPADETNVFGFGAIFASSERLNIEQWS